MLARLKAALRPLRLYRAARFGWHFARDPVFRRDHRLLWSRPENLFQHRSVTAPDRYPALFDFLRARLASRPDVRLLSFGCATGEEVFSLRRYFPAAFIKGIDINPGNIATARARLLARGADPAIVFEENNSAAGELAGAYDAILCMAVFVRWQLREDRAVASCAPHLRFADFERTVAGLAAGVRPGGYFVIRHAMFRFEDTAAAGAFEPVMSLPTPAEFFPRFDRDDCRLPDDREETVIFRKSDRPVASP